MTSPFQLPKFASLQKVHIIGVCGTLMGAFAVYLQRQGIRVSGSDQCIYPPMSDVLNSAGIQVLSGYRAENICALGEKPDLVVIGNVIRANNPEAREAIDGGFVYSSLPEAMEKLLLQKTRNLVVAGTHGKTTTSSLLAHCLTQCQKNPNYFIGGVSHDLPFSFQIASIDPDHLFVLEGDEYDTAFWDKVPKFNHYLPDEVILTSVEYDHADIYPDLDSIIRAFAGLISRVRPGGRMIGCWDYSIVRDLMKQSSVPVISYGSSMQTQARFTPANVKIDVDGTRFEVLDQGQRVDEIFIQLPGNHNILNSLSIWIQCQQLGLDMREVGQSLRSFRGVKRRQEVRGEVGGVIVIDDFAHHPTAVRETLKALKAKYSGRRMIAVFEPRSATSRRKIFQKDYASALSEANLVFIASPYDQTQISLNNQFSSDTLVDDLKNKGIDAFLIQSANDAVLNIAEICRPGDLVAVLSNGGFDGLIGKLLDRLQNI